MKDAGRDTTHHASRNYLVLENVFGFSIKFVSKLVDPSYFVFESCCGRVAEEASNRFSDKGRSICRNMIDLFSEIIGDGDLYAHIIKVSQECSETQRGVFVPSDGTGGGE